MKTTKKILSLPVALIYCLFQLINIASSEKFKVCVVDGKGGFDRSATFCPDLDKSDSPVECVIAVDRLDCLRRLTKGSADFSVLTPEDLVTAVYSEIDVLITDELRYTDDDYEYEVVAVIDYKSRIESRHDLKDRRFCHPGYGARSDWTTVLSNYLEAMMVPPLCEENLTLTENRIRASSQYFRSACKAGDWVSDPQLDRELKAKYPNLCQICDNPSKCSTDDKYWGRRGPLFCLTDGAGEVAWARLDDVRVHFGLRPGATQASPDNYGYLCPNDYVMPLNSTRPCVWVAKPWPVIATRRSMAQDVQALMKTLDSPKGNTWETSLLSLIQTIHSYIYPMSPVYSIEDYLEQVNGYLSAYSFSGCHPPRTIRICTTCIVENAKCAWLRESAAAYGIEPDLECLKADNLTHCMDAVAHNVADVVMVPSDLVHLAEKSYNLKTLFYEAANDDAKYLTVAVTKNGSTINSLKDMKGKKACFPSFDGVAWNSVVQSLHNRSLFQTCPFINAMSDFFGPSCVPNLPHGAPSNLGEICGKRSPPGDPGAIQCLLYGDGDVAFISKNSLIDFIKNSILNRFRGLKMSDFNIICESESTGCHLGWASLGRGMIRGDTKELWMKDSFDVFMQLDAQFGRNYKSPTPPLQIFGLFDERKDVLFHDNTARFRNTPNPRNSDRVLLRNYDSILANIETCKSSSNVLKPISMAFIVSYLLLRILM